MVNMARRERGFSLIEVIVALSILTICVAVLMRVFSSTVLATQTTNAYYTALEIAESRLGEITVLDDPLGSDSGETGDGYRWRTQVSKYEIDADNPLFPDEDFADAERNYIPYLFEVEVQWGSYRTYHLELSTLRLGVNK